MNFFKKQLLHHRLHSIFVDIRNNAFLLSGPTVRTISTLWPRPINMTYYAIPQKFLNVSHHRHVSQIDIFLALIYAASGANAWSHQSFLLGHLNEVTQYTKPLNVISRVKIWRVSLFHFFTKLGR